MNYPLDLFDVNMRFEQPIRNIAAKNKMAAAIQHKVLQNLDWDDDTVTRIIGGMYGDRNATASSQ